MNYFLKELRSNLALIILVPTILGGIWQIIALSSISTSYIRFFSITQLVSDGLLILFVFVIILISTILSKAIRYYLTTSKQLSELSKSIIISLISIVLIVAMYIIIFHYKVLNLGVIALLIGSLTFSTNVIFNEVILKKVFGKHHPSFLFNPKKITLSILISSILYLLFTFPLYNWYFLISPSLTNFSSISCKIRYDYSDEADYSIAYFNDKFIFASIKMMDSKKFIEVYKFNELFNDKNCYNYYTLKRVEQKKDSIAEKTIKSTLIDMWNAIEKGDIERYASYIHEDFTQFGENDSILRSGKVAEIKGIKDWIGSSSPIHTKMHEPNVTINGNTAFITYYWSDSGSTNGKPFATRGKSTRIFVKENDKWLCIHGHYTLLPNSN